MKSPDEWHRFLFYAPNIEEGHGSVLLDGDEHRHLSRVLRMTVGDRAFVTNGRGLIVRCDVAAVDGESSRLVVQEVETAATASRDVVLALACLRKEAFGRAVEQCTELGMTECIPFVAAKSHQAEFSSSFLDRLRRITISAMKQSFRAVLPEVSAAVSFDEIVERAKKRKRVVVGAADGYSIGPLRDTEALMIVVGPEGGFTAQELDQLTAAGGAPASVSAHRLRSETAAAALLTVLLSGSAATAPAIDRE